MFSSSEELSVKQERKQTPMKSAPNILPIGLDVHKESIAVIAAADGSVRCAIPGLILEARARQSNYEAMADRQ